MFKAKLDLESLKRHNKPRSETYQEAPVIKAKGFNTTLSEYVPSAEMPWDRRRASHLMRRIGFGVHHSKLDQFIAGTPSEKIGVELWLAQNGDLPTPPDWINKVPPPQGSPQSDFDAYFEENRQLYLGYIDDWMALMQQHPLREKMTLFWHNHFVTQITTYQLAPFSYRYITALRKHAVGNFKDFVREIGLDHAMLIYLDGILNRAGSPNENYARELLELFTMGIGNYTQNDIEEIARALTGHFVNYFTFEKGFNPQWHDSGEKTFFGRTGNFDYDDVIDIIFEERADEIADHICRKLYQFFVYEGVNENIITSLKQVFLDNDFEIMPVIETLIRSEHFFDDEFIGAKIKGPVDFLTGMYNEANLYPAANALGLQTIFLSLLDQFLLNPPNVAGWPEYHSWLSTTTMTYRWLISDYLVDYNVPNVYEIDAFEIANAMSNPEDAVQLSRDLAEYMLAVPLPDDELNELPNVLLDGLPEFEWSLSFDGAETRIKELIKHIRRLPEYNLM